MKGFKIIASIFFVIMLIAIAAMVSLATFVSPNRFKPLIVEQVKKYTGRDLIIDGDLSWTFLPTLGMKVGHLQLNNTSDFKQKIFAEMDSATISVKLLPLLHKKIESNGITLKGLKLNLIKNTKGMANWADLQKPKTEASKPQSTEEVTASPKKAAFGLAVTGLDISNATVHWDDEQAKQVFDLNKLELHVKEITLLKPIPFSASFTFAGSNPAVSGQVSLTSNISVNLEKQLYAVHEINLATQITQGAKHFDITVKGDAVADLAKENLQLDNLQGQISNLNLSGKMTVTDLMTKPATSGHLAIAPFDVKKWLKDTGEDVAALQSLSQLSGEFDFTAGTSLSSVTMKGSVKMGEVQASNIRVTNIDVRTALQQGTLDLSPMTADFYQGTLNGSAKINLTTPEPRMAINAKLTNMQAAPLLADVAKSDKIKITGTGNVDVQVTTSGTTSDAMTKNLNGTAKMSFNNGTLQGVDVGYLFDSALAFAKKQTNSTENSKQTPFGTLTASAVITNGIVKNNDLKMDSPRFESTGSGTINLVAQKIQYQLQTKAKKTEGQPNGLINMYGLSIPITISGDLTNPTVALDTTMLMKSVAEQQMQKAKADVKEKIAGKIKDKLPGAAGNLLNNLLGN